MDTLTNDRAQDNEGYVDMGINVSDEGILIMNGVNWMVGE